MQIYPTTLKQNSVSIILDFDDMLVKAYANSPQGREDLQAEVDGKTVEEVFEVWGDSPTLEDIDYTIIEE